MMETEKMASMMMVMMKMKVMMTTMDNKNDQNGDSGNAHTTRLFAPSTSTLLPNTTNGKFSGSDGLAWKEISVAFRPLISQTFMNFIIIN